VKLVWASIISHGSVKDGDNLHLIDPDQIGTSQAALCDLAPDVGWSWDPLEGPSSVPCCLACQREMALTERGRAVRHRARKLRLVKG
jgi:hypothetical protein